MSPTVLTKNLTGEPKHPAGQAQALLSPAKRAGPFSQPEDFSLPESDYPQDQAQEKGSRNQDEVHQRNGQRYDGERQAACKDHRPAHDPLAQVQAFDDYTGGGGLRAEALQ
jgi:hypothetical protein